MTKELMKFKPGDSVIVKPGITDPDLGIGLEGWQGRVSKIDGDLICIDWDSITLKQIPASAIKKCEQGGMGWNQIYLGFANVQLTESRDTAEDVEDAFGELQDEYAWVHLGEEGERIQEVLSGISSADDQASFQAWEEYLQKNLELPFKAMVDELQERGPLQAGDNVVVSEMEEEFDDLYGILVKLKHRRSNYVFPLADLEVIDKKSKNYQFVKDYVIWFANR
ncbi:MAG: hypothetical protein GY862_36530 [Gammaproteobacteria bacterium]|nr:hypothetical protein [Gammaproteobacteria bacterium]